MALLKGDSSDDLTLKYLLQNASGDGASQAEIDALKAIVGDTPLTTTADNLTDAVNELDTDMDGKVSKTGDTMPGDLVVAADVFSKTTDFTNNVPVASDTAGRGYNFYDSEDTLIGYILPRFFADGRQGIRIAPRRPINGINQIFAVDMMQDASGNPSVNMSSAGATAFMDALAKANSTTTTTISDIVTAASGVTINSASYAQCGKLAMIYINVTKSAAVTTAANITLGTLVSGKRPPINCMGMVSSSTINHAYVNSSGVLTAYGTWSAGTAKSFYATYLLA